MNPGPERSLPEDLLSERMCLGSILVNDGCFEAISAVIGETDFSITKHRRIFSAMKALRESSERVDRVTVATELKRRGHLEAVDGLTYLLSLDDGMPVLPHPESYARSVKKISIQRQLIEAGHNLANAAWMAGADPEELISSHHEHIVSIQSSRAPEDDGGRTPEQIIATYPGGPQGFLDPASRAVGLSTGFAKFDEMTGGLQEGDLIIIAGRPSMGKTALAINIAQHVALHPKMRMGAAVFSLEMSGSSLMTRMVCSAGRVDMHKFRAGYLNADERRKLQMALGDLTSSRLVINDRSEMPLASMCNSIRRLVKEDGVKLVVIDYLQLMATPNKRSSENRSTELGGITRTLKLLAKELDVPIMVLSQLSRACETRPGDHKPLLSDLRESGSIEQDADIVCFVYREEVYKRDREDLRGLADLIISKQRNGPIGTVPLRFLGQFTRFENRAEDLPYDED